jgi:endonuclease/exonuclease/phosphatase family metal-dependent hydrolase
VNPRTTAARALARVAAIALLLATATALHAARLRVATYNVRNYNLENRSVEGHAEPEYPKPEKEKTALRFVLRALNADVLALQETGGTEFITELQRDLAREGLHYPHTAVLPGPDPRRQLAVLSRLPIKNTTPAPHLSLRPANVPGIEGEVSRGLLTVTIATTAGDLHCHNIHLKSRLSRDPADPLSARRRLAEARALRAAITKTTAALANIPAIPAAPAAVNNPHNSHSSHNSPASPTAANNALILLCGDFNDTPTSKPLREFSAPRAIPHLAPLPAKDSRGETWTSRHAREDAYDRSDYIFHSPALAPYIPAAAARIADLPATITASDHRPVYVDLELP